MYKYCALYVSSLTTLESCKFLLLGSLALTFLMIANPTSAASVGSVRNWSVSQPAKMWAVVNHKLVKFRETIKESVPSDAAEAFRGFQNG